MAKRSPEYYYGKRESETKPQRNMRHATIVGAVGFTALYIALLVLNKCEDDSVKIKDELKKHDIPELIDTARVEEIIADSAKFEFSEE